MKVFISWSGDRSRATADLLNEWLKCVLQAIRPWISTRDIDRGALWFTEIGDQLKETTVGIVCLTAENKDKPWILFEAGALAKGLTTNRVCTFLVDLTSADIRDPLAQFNHTSPDKQGLRSLVLTLNAAMATPLDDKTLTSVFDTYWPAFESRFREILRDTPGLPEGPAAAPSQQDLLADILESTRSISHRLRAVEKSVEEKERSPDIAYDRYAQVRDMLLNDIVMKGDTFDDVMSDGSAAGFSPISIDKRWQVLRTRRAQVAK
ncbi:MAG: toll/interleukin-1 receptor domain-containing protein [Massilia sp.]|nr:MAG: toll/interleukin-1 receptor domain-containing protein [Massilia sp.]